MSLNQETNLKYSCVLFGDFSHIRPDEQTLKNCIESYFSLGVIPGGNLQEMDPRTNRLETRLSLQSVRDGITVNFLNGRIDLFAMPLPGSPAAALDLERFCSRVSEIYTAIHQTLKVDFVRIGFVTEQFLRPLSPERLDISRRAFIGDKLAVFPALEPTEWNARYCVVDDVGSPIEQKVNVTYNVSRVKLQIGDMSGQRDFETLSLVVDINSPPERRLNSSPESLGYFLKYSQEKESVISQSLKRVAYESF